jgi:pimeloyl-ACP methyl ester carboxylesterase
MGRDIMTRLDAGGGGVKVGDFVLYTQGVTGEAEAYTPRGAGVRSEGIQGRFDDVLEKEGMREQAILELTDVDYPQTPGAPRGASEAAQIAFEAPAPPAGHEQVVAVQNEDGSMAWHFGRDDLQAPAPRGGPTRRYVVDLHAPAATDGQGPAETRGLFGKLGRKIIKVLVFEAAQRFGESLVRKWEVSKRPYRVREFTTDDWRTYDAAEIAGDRWQDLAAGRALLFIHGTNSQVHSGYYALPEDALGSFHSSYEHRVFGFDHPTLSVTPTDNVNAFLEKIPSGVTLDVDIVAHSRGGLVAREFAELPSDAPVRVHQVVLVATPNGGTALADGEHIKEFVDTYTNFIDLIPDSPFTIVLESVIALVKDVALGAFTALDGLRSMVAGDEYLTKLNDAAGTSNATYAAVAAEYEPRPPFRFPMWLRDKVFDKVFEKQPNDLVVPTAGSHTADRALGFPVQDRLEFGPDDGLHHSAFFGDERVIDFFKGRLTGQR